MESGSNDGDFRPFMGIRKANHGSPLREWNGQTVATGSTALNDKLRQFLMDQIKESKHGVEVFLQSVTDIAGTITTDTDRAVIIYFQVSDFITSQKINDFSL